MVTHVAAQPAVIDITWWLQMVCTPTGNRITNWQPGMLACWEQYRGRNNCTCTSSLGVLGCSLCLLFGLKPLLSLHELSGGCIAPAVCSVVWHNIHSMRMLWVITLRTVVAQGSCASRAADN
jgi:hypothetical protein